MPRNRNHAAHINAAFGKLTDALIRQATDPK